MHGVGSGSEIAFVTMAVTLAAALPARHMISMRMAQSLHWGLNPGPSVYRTDALPLSYKGLAWELAVLHVLHWMPLGGESLCRLMQFVSLSLLLLHTSPRRVAPVCICFGEN